MANFKYTSTKAETVQFKGILSDDAKTITISDKKLGDQDYVIQDYLDKFKNEAVTISISLKSEEDLSGDEFGNDSEE